MATKASGQRIYEEYNKPFPWTKLDPASQNIPLNEDDKNLRPPAPRMPDGPFDIFLGISSYRDGVRCGFTLFTAFSRAKYPERVFVGLVDQTQDDDAICIEEYCKLAKASEWKKCKYKENIRVDKHNSIQSKGPTVARWYQQQLIKDEEFCLAIDAHSQFLPDWDTKIVEEWLRTENEMAVLTTYPMDYKFMGPDLTIPERYSSHLCNYLPRRNIQKVPVIRGMMLIDDSEAPQMSTLWGGCLSFSKCHAERRAGNDKHTNWLFWGEEYLRSMLLWTRGYDLYSPSRHGHVVFHNWSNDQGPLKKRFWDNVTQTMTQEQHDLEEKMMYNRLRWALTLPLDGGEIDAQEIEKFYSGHVRTAEQFLNFSGISNVDPALDEFRCGQLHWVPYAVPEIIEKFLPGYKMRSSVSSALSADRESPIAYAKRLESMEGQLKEVLKNSWQKENMDALREIKQELAKLAGPRSEEKEHFLKVEHQLNELTQPQTPVLVPLALVWLALITVWIALRGRRKTYEAVPTEIADC
ncbi:hypothetical protein LEN26_019208 [Aphanomyces euteiches]|nr:hypothetical protein LEN26_019208 [Aphanomyces euteiches]